MKAIPVYEPWLTDIEKQYLNEAFDSGWISSRGNFIDLFEKKLSEITQIKNITLCSNGTVALHLALLAIGIKPGDEVLVPDLTYVATANAVRYCGAKPVFVDVDRNSWNMCSVDLQNKISKSSKGIIAVHLYGVPADMLKICDIASKSGLNVIEDCAEAIGASISKKHVGTFGDISTFSFFGNKTITTGEGGAVGSKNPKFIERVKKLKNQFVSNTKEYWHSELGYNYRMTNLQAAIGVAQAERFDEIIKQKLHIEQIYKNQLKNLVDFQIIPKNCKSSAWMIAALLVDKTTRDKVRIALKNKFIETRPLFPTVSQFPIYKENFSPKSENSISLSLSERGVNFPSSPLLTDPQIYQICSIIKNTVEKN